MYQPAKWWAGFIAVGALWLGADIFQTSSIEADLGSRATGAVAAASPDTASALTVSAAGRDISIAGPEFAAGQGAQVASAAAVVGGVRLVNSAFQPVPVASPYVFSAMRTTDQITLSGAVPNPAVRASLLAAAGAAAKGATIDDKLAYASGAPDGFDAMAARAVAEAARLGGGVAALSDKAYSISGAAPTSAIFAAATAATQQLPTGFTLAKADISAPLAKPFAWMASSDGVTTTLGGVAPSIAARAAIAAAASSFLPGKVIVNNIQIASGAPAGDFVAATTFALNELGRLAKGRVSISDGAFSITGEAATSQAYEAVTGDVKKLPEGMSLANVDILPPVAKPFDWSASLGGDAVTLTGSAPSPDARDAIAKAAADAFPGKQIINQMGIARGAPAGDFAAAAGVALSQLAALVDGKATISDAAFSIVGQGAGDASNASVSAAATAKLPAPFAVASVDIKAAAVSPYTFGAAIAGDKVTLTGYAPDDKARQDIVAAAKAAFFNDEVIDALKIGKGAPAHYVDALKALFGPMARLTGGTLSLSDGSAKVDGLAVYEKAADQIKAALAGVLPAGFKLDSASITAAPPGPALQPAECQPKFDGLLAKGRIQFETGNATISKESAAVLDTLAGLVIACRDATIEVGGYTDSVGASDKNLDLSKRRAQAVVDYFAEAGIDVGRVTSAGYGDAKPVASNDTPEGRAQNRRIEFLVK